MGDSNSLIAVQMQLAHLERFVDQLNEVITAQGRQLDRQQVNIDRLLKTIDDLKTKSQPGGSSSDLESRRLEDERPPHY